MALKKSIDFILGAFLSILMAIITIDVLWGVFTRYILGHQVSWSGELARFLLIWIGILGAAYVAGQNMHLSIDLLAPKLNDRNRKHLFNFINLLVILFAFFVMIIGGGRLMYISQILGQLSPALQIPMAFVYGIIPVSGILISYYKILEIFKK